MMQQAIEYLRQGFSVIPAVPKEKKFLISWADYQKKLPTESDIRQWWTKWPDANIGLVTGQISNLAVIDIDSAEGKEQIEEYLPDTLVFPIAHTPRGGQHWFFRCFDADLLTQAPIPGFAGVDIRANGGVVIVPPSVGVNGKQYQWQNGLEISKIPIPKIPERLYAILPKKTDVMPLRTYSNDQMFVEGRRDEDLFHIAYALVRAKLPEPEIYATLLRLASACSPPFPQKEAEQKVVSALRRALSQPRDIKQEVSAWCMAQDGHFRLESCFSELTLRTKEQKAECRAVIADLSARGIIERDKGIGIYRLIDKSIEHIELMDERPEPLDIKWPFGIEQFADIYPGNVAIVAGTSNAGKTALLLNFAAKNMDKFQIRYQSSEMDSDELSMRLRGFEAGLNAFRQKIEWIKRSTDWWDIILPDAINIIDFMEIHEDFYKVGGWIKKVFDRLKKGIAVIALQKTANTEIGRGGAVTKEKARLYLSIDYGTLTIVKAKNWHDQEVNPNGRKIDFTMERGVILKNIGFWR